MIRPKASTNERRYETYEMQHEEPWKNMSLVCFERRRINATLAFELGGREVTSLEQYRNKKARSLKLTMLDMLT